MYAVTSLYVILITTVPLKEISTCVNRYQGDSLGGMKY